MPVMMLTTVKVGYEFHNDDDDDDAAAAADDDDDNDNNEDDDGHISCTALVNSSARKYIFLHSHLFIPQYFAVIACKMAKFEMHSKIGMWHWHAC